ncbi:MAG: TetR/AcrR family transcriptional regulator [Proteobacteria bacterium]|nr:TetR/AcrR family transcriptional regulator [Pseudomonadota bacterium]
MADRKGRLPRVPRRVRGMERYTQLLDAADALLRDREPGELVIQDVATHAGVPLASVYHYFPSNVAVIAGVAQRYIERFEEVLTQPMDHAALNHWTDIVREHARRSTRFFNENPIATKLILGGDGISQLRSLDKESNERLARRYVTTYRRHFVLPDDPILVDRCAIAITIMDAVTSLSYSRHGRITPEMAEEAVQARLAYLTLYIPQRAPKRPKPLP